MADRWRRWMPASGIVFGILFVVGLLMNNLPSGTDAEVNAFYAKSSNRIVTVVSAYVLVVAALAFLIFLVDVRRRLRSTAGGDSAWTDVSFVSGLMFVAALLVAGVTFASVAGNIQFGGDPQPAADVARQVPELADPILVVAGALAAALLVASTSVVALQTGILPRWLGWLGFVLVEARRRAALVL